MRLPPPYDIAGVPVHPLHLTTLLDWVEARIVERTPGTLFYANAHAVTLAERDRALRAAFHGADGVFCDGQGVRLGAALLGTPLPERFTPPDWLPRLAARCARRGARLFFLGAEPGIAEQAAARLRGQFPTLHIATHPGFFAPVGAENEQLLARILEEQPDLLLVGMGMPRQELWIGANRARLASVPVVMAVGALFDYMAGQVPRGPRWLTDNGLEWLCRLWYEPRRLWRRYLLGNPAFLALVLRQRLRRLRGAG